MTLYRLGSDSPEIDPSSWVAPGAHAIGKVRLGAKASIWFGATLRGDIEGIEIAEGSNVQEVSVLHTDAGFPLNVGRDCTIGHRAILHGCTIGDQSLIGMGAIVLNGARIGRNCLIGAGALVPEGRVIPDGMLALGMPAKPVRPLTDAEIQGLRASALHYQERARLFREGLAEL
jgi:carbonic anhydrase/acetyltransferase-like protein (isoleucine patch superfamily)